MSWAFAIVLVLLLAAGCFFIVVGSLGLVKLSDFFKRLHAPTKASTLGAGCVLLASLLHFSSSPAGLNLHELLILIFLFVTAPISAQLLAKTTPLPHQADDG